VWGYCCGDAAFVSVAAMAPSMRNSIPYLSPSGHFGPFDLLGHISRRDRFNQRAERPFFVSQSTLFDWQSGPIEQGEADASQHGRDKGEADCAAQRYQLRTASQNPTKVMPVSSTTRTRPGFTPGSAAREPRAAAAQR